MAPVAHFTTKGQKGLIISMGYLLNGTSIPRPKTFKKGVINQRTDMTTLDGKTSRDQGETKESYFLGWELLSKTEADSLTTIVGLNQPVSFEVDDSDIQITAVDVWPVLSSREYKVLGSDYLVDLMLELVVEEP